MKTEQPKTLQECKDLARDHYTNIELRHDKAAEIYTSNLLQENQRLQKEVEQLTEIREFLGRLVTERKLERYERDEIGEPVWSDTDLSIKAKRLLANSLLSPKQ